MPAVARRSSAGTARTTTAKRARVGLDDDPARLAARGVAAIGHALHRLGERGIVEQRARALQWVGVAFDRGEQRVEGGALGLRPGQRLAHDLGTDREIDRRDLLHLDPAAQLGDPAGERVDPSLCHQLPLPEAIEGELGVEAIVAAGDERDLAPRGFAGRAHAEQAGYRFVPVADELDGHADTIVVHPLRGSTSTVDGRCQDAREHTP